MASSGSSNSHRGSGPHTDDATSLDNATSICENNMTTMDSTTTRSDTLHYSDMPPIAQWLNLDPITLSNRNLTYVSELKRVLRFTLDTSSEVEHNSFGVSEDDLKRIRSGIADNSSEARERSKHLSDCISKLDEYRHALSSMVSERSSSLPCSMRNADLVSPRFNEEELEERLVKAQVVLVEGESSSSPDSRSVKQADNRDPSDSE